MSESDVLEVIRQSLWIILKLCMPILVVSIAIGLVIAVFQAATQIHEQTITFAPKLVATAFLLIVTGSWMLHNLMDFFQSVILYMLEL
ncbi:MAG: flagellar biosynthesis protein FliQ [Faecalibacterium sp.]|jgi:flagellar biosynthetic protein FliQ|nr:flagellar biosynthesis protein FliQ [Faecalibacterium sp.]